MANCLGTHPSFNAHAIAVASVSVAMLSSCAMWPPQPAAVTPNLPSFVDSSGYQPSEPLHVVIADNYANADLLFALPNESVRVAYGFYDLSGELRFGPATANRGHRHMVIMLDYFKYRMFPVPVTVTFEPVEESEAATRKLRTRSINVTPSGSAHSVTCDPAARESSGRLSDAIEAAPFVSDNSSLFRWPSYSQPRGELPILNGSNAQTASINTSIPVYIGIGMRVRADITLLEQGGSIEISQLGDLVGLGLAARNNQITGTLLVQTLGISGPDVSPYIPAPSEINATTISNAMQAIATIKSKMYTATESQPTKSIPPVVITPAIIAFDDYLGLEGSTRLLPVALLERPLKFSIDQQSKRSIVSILDGPEASDP